MDTIERTPILGGRPTAAAAQSDAGHERNKAIPPNAKRAAVLLWLINDIPFLAMLTLAIGGVVLRLSLSYWVILTPVFAVISIAEGWRNGTNRSQRLELVVRLALDWCALLVAIYLLYNGGVQGIMNANAISLSITTLLALGTFVAGVQARVWQICAVGAVLFLAVPGLGWLDQSPLLLLGAAFLILVLCSLAWWFMQRPNSTVPNDP